MPHSVALQDKEPRARFRHQTYPERTHIMIFDLETFTLIHVVISLVGIGSGFVVVYGLLTGRRLRGWTALFLATTVATSMAGAWRWIYVVGAVVSLYLNVFVGVVQAFQKVPALKALAPTQSEAPFLLTQLVVLLLFVALAVVAAVRFRVEP